MGVRKPRRQALSGLSFEVPEGGVLGLLGPNGAGKTTTLKCIVDLIKPESGSIWLFGQDSAHAETRKRVGFLPEQPYFELYLTPRKLLMYYSLLEGMDRPTARSRISHTLNLVGMEGEADLPMEKHSKGMLQRIGLAQSLIAQPDLLILDEPSSGLDPLGKLQVRDLLDGLRRSGTTILISSHQLSEIEEICDGVVIIHRGRRVASGKLEELLRREEESEVLLKEPLGEAPDGLPASASWRDDGLTRLTVHGSDLDAALRVLLDAGAAVAEVRERRMTLEEYFVEMIGERGWEVRD